VPLTLAQLLGTPAHADARDLDRAIERGKKASGGGSAIAVGRVAFQNNATGIWAIATSGSTGRMGVVPNLDPVNLDAETNITLVTGRDAEIYVELNGTVKPGSFVVPDTGGKVKQRTTEAAQAIVGVYRGHYGEGSGLGSPPTDGLAGEAGRISLVGGVA
jgi:hypothetical protein